MSDNQTTSKPKAQRLSPNARAQLISEYNAGKELSNPDYYVIKNKDGKLNVRRKREKKETEKKEEQPQIPAKEEEVKEEPEKKPKAL